MQWNMGIQESEFDCNGVTGSKPCKRSKSVKKQKLSYWKELQIKEGCAIIVHGKHEGGEYAKAHPAA